MLNDLAALTPPLLVCAVFLFAVAAFLRREMRNADSQPQGGPEADSASGPESEPDGSNRSAPSQTRPSGDAARADRTDGTGRTSGD
jgi:hypothetical protein